MIDKMNKHMVLRILLLILLTGFVSCKKENIPPELTDAQKARNDFYSLMKDWYLWYDMMPEVNVDDYDSPETLLEALRYQPVDKWSFIASYQEFQEYFEAGKYLGFGFGYSYDDSGDPWVAFVFKDSELYTQGVRRGWKIDAIDGTPIDAFANLTPLMGDNVAGVSKTFTFTEPDQSTVDITATKDTVTINSVLAADTLHVAGHTVGHLVFQTFISPSAAELDSAFAYFKQVNVDRLIVDLRYNGGGDMDIATALAGMIGGPSLTGKTFISLKHNDKRSDYDMDVTFAQEDNELSMNDVIFITSRGSASASEALISGLKPYVSVTLIGDNTYGKPVGMHSWIYNDYVFVPVSFRMVNADGETDYFNGLTADDFEADGLQYGFSDRREDRLAAAIYYIENGSFPTQKKMVTPDMPVPHYTGLRFNIGAL